MDKKILILVLSYMEPPYDELLKVQRETWDSIEVEGVRTVYYYGGGKGWVNDKEFSGVGIDSYYYMHDKFVSCLWEMAEFPEWKSWDMIFRTNSSSYVNKKKLVEICESMPKQKFYGGWEIQGNAGYNVVSGSGIFMSPDVAEILMNEIQLDFEKEEDCYIASILNDDGIKIIDDKSRWDVDDVNDSTPTDRYHYRFKTASRYNDADNMRKLHKLLNP
jgi:hypothetical protein